MGFECPENISLRRVLLQGSSFLLIPTEVPGEVELEIKDSQGKLQENQLLEQLERKEHLIAHLNERVLELSLKIESQQAHLCNNTEIIQGLMKNLDFVNHENLRLKRELHDLSHRRALATPSREPLVTSSKATSVSPRKSAESKSTVSNNSSNTVNTLPAHSVVTKATPVSLSPKPARESRGNSLQVSTLPRRTHSVPVQHRVAVTAHLPIRSTRTPRNETTPLPAPTLLYMRNTKSSTSRAMEVVTTTKGTPITAQPPPRRSRSDTAGRVSSVQLPRPKPATNQVSASPPPSRRTNPATPIVGTPKKRTLLPYALEKDKGDSLLPPWNPPSIDISASEPNSQTKTLNRTLLMEKARLISEQAHLASLSLEADRHWKQREHQSFVSSVTSREPPVIASGSSRSVSTSLHHEEPLEDYHEHLHDRIFHYVNSTSSIADRVRVIDLTSSGEVPPPPPPTQAHGVVDPRKPTKISSPSQEDQSSQSSSSDCSDVSLHS